MKKFILIPFVFLILFSSSIVGQKNNNNKITQQELDAGTIEQQFDYIITKSSKFRDFQLIRKTSILKIKAHTLDSIKAIRTDLIKANKSISQIESTISSLENEVSSLKFDVETISKEVDSISFLGTLLSKSLYNTIVWGIIIVLLIALLFFITRFKSSNTTTKRTKNDLNKLETEFEDFRKNSLKKEQETMRKLQDEINKNHP